MMFDKWKRAIMVLFCMTLILQSNLFVHAKVSEGLPEGDILLIYSDGASDEDIDNVKSIVEYLTYQRFKVTYAPASKCLGNLSKFSSILCYKIERYPNGLIGELKERVEEGNRRLKSRENIKKSSGEDDVRVLVIGNQFLKDYLNEAVSKEAYIDSKKQTGKLKYSFSDSAQKEALVKEDNLLFLSGELDYRAGTLDVEGMEGYYCARVGALYHISVTDLKNNLVMAALVKELAMWMWPYNGEPHAYAQYIALNKVYPFQDADKLFQIVKYLIDKKEPFVITVMPVYTNGNYPAMQHFCEVLRYAQANGGTIIMHSPINQMATFDVDLVNEYITTAIRVYMKQGVYPMGIQVPRNWMFHNDTIEVMSRFSTVLVSDEVDSLIKADEDVNTNMVYKDGHQWLAPTIELDKSGISYLKTNSFEVDFDMTEDMGDIESKINACIESFVPLKSLWDIDHSLWTEEDVINYKNQIILVNGKRVENKFTATKYDDTFKYRRNMLQRYSTDLSVVNKKLLILVTIISGIFIAFIFTARHRNKQAFFIKNSRKRSETEDDLSEERLEQMLQEDERKPKKPPSKKHDNTIEKG